MHLAKDKKSIKINAAAAPCEAISEMRSVVSHGTSAEVSRGCLDKVFTKGLEKIRAFATGERFAARVGFFAGGFTVASWAPLIPFVQSGLELDPMRLGLLLLGLGFGSFFGMPVAGRLSSKIGSRATIAFSALASCALLVLLAAVIGYYEECVLLFLYGVTLGSLEVGVNIYGTGLEKRAGHRLMSGLHASYSIGEVCAAGVISGLFFFNAPPFVAVFAAMTALALLVIHAVRFIPSKTEERTRCAEAGEGESGFDNASQPEDPNSFVMPKGFLLVISLVCAAVFLSEAAVLDWSSVYLRDFGGIPVEASGFGYTVFVVAMAISRLLGDRIADKFGAVRVLSGGLLLQLLSLAAMIVFPMPAVLFASLFSMGLGIANLAPILISSSSRIPGVPSLAAVTTTSTVGYGGLMIGPGILGFIAESTSLAGSFVFVAVLIAAALLTVQLCRKRFCEGKTSIHVEAAKAAPRKAQTISQSSAANNALRSDREFETVPPTPANLKHYAEEAAGGADD